MSSVVRHAFRIKTGRQIVDDVLSLFHPVIQEWFRSKYDCATEPQLAGWPVIASGQHTLIAAPTGSGKTLTAFLAIIDRLLRAEIDGSGTVNGIQVVYVSPLRALSNDMERNLNAPLEEIRATASAMGIEIPAIRVGLRTGDTTSYRRQQIVKKPPEILVTTPESLYLMLTSEKSREVLRSVETVIVDEIHALVRDKRGSHLSLTLERLEALVNGPVDAKTSDDGRDAFQRIGLSATQRPIERMAEFLIGNRGQFDESDDQDANGSRSVPVKIVDVGHQRDLDLAIETPPSELSAVCSNDQWDEVNQRIVELIQEHRSTLIFVNTRRLAERVTFQLTNLLGEDAVGSHHGSLSKEKRLSTEQRLKNGQLKAVVATASLELGIDVGYIDLVVQLGSPRAIAAFLQRIGRSGHALGLVPKGRLFALTRDELMECMGLIRAVKNGRLDIIPIPIAPLDILAQQMVAELGCDEWNVDELYNTFRRAWPYRDLAREKFDEVLKLVSDGITPDTGRKTAMVYHDKVNSRLKGRPAARMKAIMNGGAIPEIDSVRVVLEDEKTVVGSVDEDFAVESMAGDIFLLGNSSWRIRGLRGNDLLVADARGAPPTIPFWRGEAPGRTLELSEEVSRLREETEQQLIEASKESSHTTNGAASPNVTENHEPEESEPFPEIVDWLQAESNCDHFAAKQIVHYIAAQRAGVGFVPTQKRVLFERFFDESGGMQLVVHAPFGSRINRAWGFAFRKRFCRSFDFELQATADDDGFILSLGPQHSFPLESLFPFMRTDNARNLLEQAMLVSPMFHMRWRWNVTRALFLARMRNGKKVPPALQRFRAEDLLTAVFPKLTGCQEEHMGDHEIPNHPLMRQTVEDVMFEAMDIEGLLDVLNRVEAGEISYVGRDTREPSPFAYELLNANPYAFLDGGEVQERRARAVATRRSLSIESVRDLGHLDPQAIADVVIEAQPLVRSPDELHDVLLSRVLIPISKSAEQDLLSGDLGTVSQRLALTTDQYREFFDELCGDGRVVPVSFGKDGRGWLATERWSAMLSIDPTLKTTDGSAVPDSVLEEWTSVDAMNLLIRGWGETCGPMTADELAELCQQPVSRVFATLEALEGEGVVLRGRFRIPPTYADVQNDDSQNDDAQVAQSETEAQPEEAIEWCHRTLLARIHRRTITGLRKEIEAVDVSVYMEFLSRHHGVARGHRKQNIDGVHEVIAQLQGMDLTTSAWEDCILAARVENYSPAWLDELCMSGDIGWGRIEPTPPRKGRGMSSISRSVPVSIFLRDDLPWIVARRNEKHEHELTSTAEQVLDMLRERGALFANDMQRHAQLLPTQLAEVLGELVSHGLITSDGFSGLRRLTKIDAEEKPHRLRSKKHRVRQPRAGVGRWNLWQPAECELSNDDVVEEWAWQLIRRWGVVFRELVVLETLAPRWWELQRAFRRLEARGEIRGGRFIKGVGGEQFGTSDSVRMMRDIRKEIEETPPGKRGDESPLRLSIISGADPMNLTGIIGPGDRIPSVTKNRVAWLAGKVVAWKKSDETWLASSLTKQHRSTIEREFGLKPSRSNSRANVDDEDSTRESNEQDGKSNRKRKPPKRSGIPKPFPF